MTPTFVNTVRKHIVVWMLLAPLSLLSQSSKEKRVEGVTVEGEFPQFVESAIIPYAHYAAEMSYDKVRKKNVALLVEHLKRKFRD